MTRFTNINRFLAVKPTGNVPADLVVGMAVLEFAMRDDIQDADKLRASNHT